MSTHPEPGTRLDHYEVLSPLGAGGMGEVYRARDTRLGREVALKVLPPAVARDAERLARFELEAQSASELNHPNILAVHDVGNDGGTSYIVTELLEGETLRERLGAGALPRPKAVEYALQIARGLAAAHRRQIAHRDLKPENIFVTADGVVKILDFGLAKRTVGAGAVGTEAPTVRANTGPGVVMGTAGYMSPEQARGRPADHRSDIFSFGCVLYEMLSGRRAFAGESYVEVQNAILKEEPPELSRVRPDMAPGLERLVCRCLEKKPEERFQSASDLAFALEALVGTQSGLSGAQGATAAAEVPRRVPGHAWLGRAGWIAAALLLASTLALAALYFRRAEPRAATMRFTLPVPEKASYGLSLALSPDGRRLAYVFIGAGGVPTLWVRPLDSVAGRELPGTEGAEFPFWSPDGRHVGFFAGNKLKKIEVEGGPVVTLADTSGEVRGGAWSADGTILFTPDFTSPLLKVSASGGAASRATELDAARQQTSHRWPLFLPGGRRFLYFARANSKEAEGIYAGSLDSKESKFILATNLLAAYAPSAEVSARGHLLFARDKTLVAQPFDADRLELSGEPSVVAQGVLAYPGEGGPTGYVAFTAAESGHLAYMSGDVLLTQLVWHDRDGKPLDPVGPPGVYGEPSLSPDGKRLVTVLSSLDAVSNDIWMLDAARATSTRFTFEPATDVCPLWTPDGSRIIFSSNRGSSNGGGWQNLYQKPASGAGAEELLLPWDRNLFADDVSADGRLMLFEVEGQKSRYDLWVLPLAGERKPVTFLKTDFNETHAQFSPDGRWVAYSSDESGRSEVYVRSFPDQGGKWQVSNAGGDQGRWRADGRELFYLAADKRLMSVPVSAAGATFEAGAPAALFTTRVPLGSLTGARNNYLAAPDGRRFLLNNLVSEGNTQPITLVLNWAADLKR